MNWQDVKNELEERYPGKNIILLPPDNPTEVLCEIEPPSGHPAFSVAISVIKKSTAHYHKLTTEEYEVIQGEVNVHIDDQKHTLKAGKKIIIKPGEKHWAESNWGWIKCKATPAWSPNDHFLY